MPTDPYSLCPGGTGKKLKFCCSDLIPELEKLERMLTGDQRLAARDYVEKLDAKTPGRACLLAYKSELQSELGEETAAQATLQQFLTLHPQNPVALAEQALQQAEGEEIVEAANSLQSALEAGDGRVVQRVYEAISVIGQMLAQQGFPFAALAHLRLQAALEGSQQRSPATDLITRIYRSNSVPLLLKGYESLLPCPAGAKWAESYESAMQSFRSIRWREAANKFAEMARQLPRVPEIWRNLATLRGWLADSKSSAAAWREMAQCAVPLDDAVEATAMADILDPNLADDVAFVKLTYDVADMAALEAKLLADPRVSKGVVDRSPADEGPPPRASFFLQDRPVPATGVGIALDAIPYILAELLSYGKQTDREARLEVYLWRDGQFAIGQQAFEQVTAGLISSRPTEETLTTRPAVAHILSWQWRLPDDTPLELRKSLVFDEQRKRVLSVWPDAPQKRLGGQTPRQAASDAKLRLEVLAQILLFEESMSNPRGLALFDQLRTELGLPTPERLTLTTGTRTSLPRLSRADASQMEDGALRDLLELAVLSKASAAVHNLAPQVESRAALANTPVLASAYGELAEAADDHVRAIEYLNRARKVVEAIGASTVTFDFQELNLQFERGDLPATNIIFQHIAKEHGREQGVNQMLYQWMESVGMIGPDGQMRGMPAAAAQESSALVLPGEAAESGKLWTPGGEQSAASGGKKLWMPGME